MSRGMLGGTGAPWVMVVAELDPLQKSMQALTLKLVYRFLMHYNRLLYIIAL